MDDPPASVASDAPSDSDPPPGIDPSAPDTGPNRAGDTAMPADTAVGPTPPASWGPGMVELTAPIWAARPLAVDPGDIVARRPPETTVAFFADLDRDGSAEVVVGHAGFAPHVRARVLRWTATGLVEDAALGETIGVGGEVPHAALDLDGDGLPDLIAPHPVGGVRWGTAPGAWGPPASFSDDPVLRGHAVAVADVDEDGWPDLVYGTDDCDHPLVIALQEAPRTFALRGDLLDTPGTGFAAQAWLIGRTRDSEPLWYGVDDGPCSASHPGGRFLRRDAWLAGRVPRFAASDATPADAWWKLLPATQGQSLAALTPMGAGLEDLDGDGSLDLVVSTGVPSQVVLRGRGDGTFEDAGSDIQVFDAPTGLPSPELPWSVGFPDLDMDGRADVVWTLGDDATSFLASRGHPMTNAVTWNGGGFALVDVGDAIGLRSSGSWRALGLGDPDGDGDADLVVGGAGNAPIVYRNDLDVGGRRGLALRLVGSTSDPLAIAARVEAHVPGLPTRTTLHGGVGNPLGISEPVVFLGAGDQAAVDLVRIAWPSGYVQEVRGLEVGRQHVVVEPPLIEVLDDDRRLPADGAVVVRLTPRTPEGAPDPATRVSLRIVGAPATLEAPLEAEGGVWTGTLRGPGYDGTSWLVVTFDGVELRVKPKLRWAR